MRREQSVWKVTVTLSIFLILFDNYSFWKSILTYAPVKEEPLLILSLGVILFCLLNLLFTLISFKPIFKLISILVILTSAFTGYFMDNYAVMIDRGMIQNIISTDVSEARELFSLRLLATVSLLGVLPAVILYKVKISYPSLQKSLIQKTLISVVCLIFISGTLYINYQSLSFFGRDHREARHLINPTNYIFSLRSYVLRNFNNRSIVTKPIETDAHKSIELTEREKPTLVILVLGETARAMNFGLNGYERDTNPCLADKNVINFEDVSSCGTATAVSVPCMFSKFPREDYDSTKGLEYENLIDVVSNAGYSVLWRNNNSGCKGVCARVEYEDLANDRSPEFCSDGNCVDEILLHDLQETIERKVGDQMIVLHMKGNHGPTYSRRYPEQFEAFTPVCKSNQLLSCSQQEIINVYDNGILYSDYVLAQTIKLLEKNSEKYETAMVYISDHGESLGEDNIYLHGLPYMIAPEEQKKVPLLFWLSDSFQKTYDMDTSCLGMKANNELSHDNLFSSMLGLLAIDTHVYDQSLDLFASCRGENVELVKVSDDS